MVESWSPSTAYCIVYIRIELCAQKMYAEIIHARLANASTPLKAYKKGHMISLSRDSHSDDLKIDIKHNILLEKCFLKGIIRRVKAKMCNNILLNGQSLDLTIVYWSYYYNEERKDHIWRGTSRDIKGLVRYIRAPTEWSNLCWLELAYINDIST